MIFDSIPLPGDPSLADFPPTAFERFLGLLLLSVIAATLFSFLIPRPLFRKLFKIAFPFMPERLEDSDEKE